VAVRRLAVAGGRVVGVDTDDGPIGADAVVLACGPWVVPLARTAGFELGITPERSRSPSSGGPTPPAATRW
jgi:glycine/D-amino acid oxidase-like deaminating enzyme